MLSKAELGHLALVYLPQSYTEIVYKNKKQARAQRLVVNETHSNEDFITGSRGGGHCHPGLSESELLIA